MSLTSHHNVLFDLIILEHKSLREKNSEMKTPVVVVVVPSNKKVVYYTEAERRKLWEDRLLEFFDSNNRLCARIERDVDIKIEKEDYTRLLDRIMKEESVTDIKRLMNGLLVSNDDYYRHRLVHYEEEMKSWGRRQARENETEEEKKLRLDAIEEEAGVPNPFVHVFFSSFHLGRVGTDENERKKWTSFYETYSAYLLEGDTNKFHIKEVLEEKGILEVVFTIYKKEIVRFNILSPFPEHKLGMKEEKMSQ